MPHPREAHPIERRPLISAAALMRAGVALVALLSVQPALAQGTTAVPVVQQAVVQPIPGATGLSLNAALARLAQDPRNVDALIDAGRAALAMNDVDAAVGFFTRADQEAPGNPRAKAGLAGALVRAGNPFDAIPMFTEAERAGAIDSALAADRGLAYDLVGDNASAQRQYQLALARESNDEVLRRLALSYAMAGDGRSADATLAPLLARQDRASFRTRAFTLATLGQTEDAVGIAYSSLPADLAAAISPYLRYMPRLTRAQQAAAANFGNFPRASEIGRDDPRVAAFAPAGSRRPAQASADSALIPRGEPLGRSGRRANRPSERPSDGDGSGRTIGRPSTRERGTMAVATPARTAPPEVQATREVSAAPATRVASADTGRRPLAPPPATVGVKVSDPTPLVLPPAPAPVVAAPAPTSTPSAAPAVARGGELPPVVPASQPATAVTRSAQEPGFATLDPVNKPAVPSFDLAAVPASAPQQASATPAPAPAVLVAAAPSTPAPAPVAQQAAPAPAPAPAAAPPPPRSLADAFSDFARPTADAAPAAGAVDIRRITPARDPAKVAEKAKPAPPAHPSRIWVQIATGRDKAALAYDWRRMTRQSAEVFRGKSPMVSAWGQTNRLLTGPFPSEAAANAYLAQLRRADVDGAFLWTSPAGQVVDALPVR